MKISDIAKQSGFSIDTLRYYDQIGLVCPQRKGYQKSYKASDLEKLSYIRILKDSSFSLEEIRTLFGLDEKYDTQESIRQMDPRDISAVRALLDGK